MNYRHTQPGYFIVAVLLLALALLGVGYRNLGYLPGFMLLFILLFACLLLFPSLTVELDSTRLRVYFGFGLISRTFEVKEIESSSIVRNPWWYGWGIRLTPHGTLFNVSGLSAVELKLRNGTRFRIGTDDAEGLDRAIKTALGKIWKSKSH